MNPNMFKIPAPVWKRGERMCVGDREWTQKTQCSPGKVAPAVTCLSHAAVEVERGTKDEPVPAPQRAPSLCTLRMGWWGRGLLLGEEVADGSTPSLRSLSVRGNCVLLSNRLWFFCWAEVFWKCCDTPKERGGVLVTVGKVQEVLSLPFLTSLIWWQRWGGMGEKETWGCRPAPGRKVAAENGPGVPLLWDPFLQQGLFRSSFVALLCPSSEHTATQHLRLVGGNANLCLGRGRGWLASPPQDSWRYLHLSMGRKKSRGTLEPSRAEDDQVGLCYIAQSKGEDKNTGLLAQW